MKKVPMIALLIVPYATLILCYQANLDITIGLWVYGALLLFNMVYAFLLPRLGFKVKQILFWNLLLKLCNLFCTNIWAIIYSLFCNLHVSTEA